MPGYNPGGSNSSVTGGGYDAPTGGYGDNDRNDGFAAPLSTPDIRGGSTGYTYNNDGSLNIGGEHTPTVTNWGNILGSAFTMSKVGDFTSANPEWVKLSPGDQALFTDMRANPEKYGVTANTSIQDIVGGDSGNSVNPYVAPVAANNGAFSNMEQAGLYGMNQASDLYRDHLNNPILQNTGSMTQNSYDMVNNIANQEWTGNALNNVNNISNASNLVVLRV